MLNHRDRIAFDLTLVISVALLIALRLWVRRKERPPNPHLTWVLADVFVLLCLAIAGSVVGLDIHLVRQWQALTDAPSPSTVAEPPQILSREKDFIVEFYKASLFNQYAYISALWSAKASFLSGYYTMSEHLSLKLRRALDCTWIALFVTWLGIALGCTFWCWPIDRNWSLHDDYACSPQTKPAQAILVYVLHMCTNIPVMFIPYLIIRKLSLGRGERYAIGFMFLLGLLASVCSTVTFALHMEFIRLHRNPATQRQLLVEKIQDIYFCGCAEVWGVIVVVCLPCARLAFRRIFRGRGEQGVQRTDSQNAIRLESRLTDAPNSEKTNSRCFSPCSDTNPTASCARYGEDSGSIGNGSLVRSSPRSPALPYRAFDGAPPPSQHTSIKPHPISQ